MSEASTKRNPSWGGDDRCILLPEAEEVETLMGPPEPTLAVLANRPTPPGQLGCDFWVIVSGCFSGLPGDAMSYRISLINYFSAKSS